MKHPLVLLTILTASTAALGQDYLDVDANTDCELFKEKKDFNREERLAKIKELGGTKVTVFVVKGKDNKIKSSYTGLVDLTLIERGESPLKNMTSVLIVTEVDANGRELTSHLPLTDDKAFRIYRTDCMSN